MKKFRERYGISYRSLCGERASVCQHSVDEWKESLGTLCSGYDPKDIFNMDQTGLLFRTPPTRSLVRKGETCSNVKKSKERLTVMAACSAIARTVTPTRDWQE